MRPSSDSALPPAAVPQVIRSARETYKARSRDDMMVATHASSAPQCCMARHGPHAPRWFHVSGSRDLRFPDYRNPVGRVWSRGRELSSARHLLCTELGGSDARLEMDDPQPLLRTAE